VCQALFWRSSSCSCRKCRSCCKARPSSSGTQGTTWFVEAVAHMRFPAVLEVPRTEQQHLSTARGRRCESPRRFGLGIRPIDGFSGELRSADSNGRGHGNQVARELGPQKRVHLWGGGRNVSIFGGGPQRSEASGSQGSCLQLAQTLYPQAWLMLACVLLHVCVGSAKAPSRHHRFLLTDTCFRGQNGILNSRDKRISLSLGENEVSPLLVIRPLVHSYLNIPSTWRGHLRTLS
jgi:hypothetical protein